MNNTKTSRKQREKTLAQLIYETAPLQCLKAFLRQTERPTHGQG